MKLNLRTRDRVATNASDIRHQHRMPTRSGGSMIEYSAHFAAAVLESGGPGAEEFLPPHQSRTGVLQPVY